MGVPTDDTAFGNDCPCFPAGKTPAKVRMAVTGIKKGGTWIPALGEPANGIWELDQVVPVCKWQGWFAPYSVLMQTHLPGSLFIVLGLALVDHFNGINVANCIWWFSNLLQDPVNDPFYGGIAQMSWMSFSPGPSMARIMDDLNIERGPDAVCDPYPTADESLLISYVRNKDNSHIWIKHKE